MNRLPILVDLASRDVVTGDNGHGLGLGVFAAKEFRPDEEVFAFDPIFVTSPEKYTIQVGEAKHLQTDAHIGLLL